MPEDVLQPVNISAFRAGNTGVDYVHRFESGRAGPEVLITALMHGNELCGAHALAHLFAHDVRPARGALTLAFCNVAAYASYDALQPTLSRALDEDMNRLWRDDLIAEGAARSREAERAQVLLPFVRRADFVLDIHSMQTGPEALTLCGLAPRGRELTRRMGLPRFVVSDAGHKAGPRMRDYGPFGAMEGQKTALLIECGYHLDPEAATVAIRAAWRFLDVLDLARPPDGLSYPPLEQVFVDVSAPVTIESEDFRFTDIVENLAVIAKAGTLIARDGKREIRTPHDDCVLIMPSRRLQPGQTAVRLGRMTAP